MPKFVVRRQSAGRMVRVETLEARRLLAVTLDDHDDHDHGQGEDCLLPLPPAFDLEMSSSFEVELAPPFPYANTFFLHSLPGADKTIHLDFDGHTTTTSYWVNNFNGGQPFDTPPFNFEGGTSVFTNAELERIQRIWERVAEDFIPFNVNVTTQEPPIEDLRKSGTGDTKWGVRVVIGGDGSWYSSTKYGGVANTGNFDAGNDSPVFVFSSNLSNNEKNVAEATSHEAGHSLGLGHDGRTSPSEPYYYGHGSGATGWAPIMGVGYDRQLVQWSKGEYLNANNTQNDLSIITNTSNGFGYRADDHGNTISTGTALYVGASGIIERNTDVDVFTFSFVNSGSVNLTISPFYRSPNLDILAQIYNSSGTLIASSNPTSTLDAALNLSLTAGVYGLFISGTGKGDPLGTGYSDYGSLGRYTIGGAFDAQPAAPTNPSPADGATNVSRVGLVLDWADAANAVSYDVYLNDMTTPKANVSVSQWTVSPQIAGGLHQWKVVARNGAAAAASAVWSFTVSGTAPPPPPVYLSPADSSIVNARPVTFDWEDTPGATAYDLYINNALAAERTNLTSSTWTGLSTGFNGAFTWRVEAKNAEFTTGGPTWAFTLDSTPPAASLGAVSPTTGATFLDFTVTYTDSTTGVDVSTLDSNDITVSGPHGYFANAAFVGVNNNSNGTPRVATYRIPAPDGFWNDADNGTYIISQVANQVSDVGGAWRAGATIGSHSFSTIGFAWMNGDTLNVAFDGSLTPVLLTTSGGNVTASKNASSPSFADVSAIAILGSSADDRLQINAPLTPPITFADSGGNDLLEILAGTYTFDSDIAPPARNLAVHVAGGATAIFNASQNLRSLSVDGVATLSASGGATITVTDLYVTGRLNLTNNALVWDYDAGSPIDTVEALISAGRVDGDWHGNGIVTDRPEAITPQRLATLGVSESPASVVVRYTFAGDANLDRVIDGDDYFAIDSGFSAQTIRWAWGDFDYNGRIDADDYFIIDLNYHRADDLLA